MCKFVQQRLWTLFFFVVAHSHSRFGCYGQCFFLLLEACVMAIFVQFNEFLMNKIPKTTISIVNVVLRLYNHGKVTANEWAQWKKPKCNSKTELAKCHNHFNGTIFIFYEFVQAFRSDLRQLTGRTGSWCRCTLNFPSIFTQRGPVLHFVPLQAEPLPVSACCFCLVCFVSFGFRFILSMSGAEHLSLVRRKRLKLLKQ